MPVLRHALSARCSPERLWTLLADLEAVARYNPDVVGVKTIGEVQTGLGACRVCALKPKGRVVERVNHWEEGRALGLEVVESDWPLRFMRWVTRVEPAPEGARLTQELEYVLNFGLLGRLLDLLVVRRKLRGALDRVLSNLVALAEKS